VLVEPLSLLGVTRLVNKFLARPLKKGAVNLPYIHQWIELWLVESGNCQGGHRIFGILQPLLLWCLPVSVRWCLCSGIEQKYPQLFTVASHTRLRPLYPRTQGQPIRPPIPCQTDGLLAKCNNWGYVLTICWFLLSLFSCIARLDGIVLRSYSGWGWKLKCPRLLHPGPDSSSYPESELSYPCALFVSNMLCIYFVCTACVFVYFMCFMYCIKAVSKQPYPVFASDRLKNCMKWNCWFLWNMWLFVQGVFEK